MSPRVVALGIVVVVLGATFAGVAVMTRESDLERAVADESVFAPLPEPGINDWLASHPTAPQTLEAFLRSPHNVPDERKVIYIQPIGEVGKQREFLEKIRRFTEAFFAMPVRILPTIDLDRQRVRSRDNDFTRTFQLYAPDLLSLLRGRLPRDGFCLLGVTNTDIYPDPNWNYAFGVAELQNRIGVYSFARFDPRRDPFDRRKNENAEEVMIERSCRVVAHEAGHMFGITHCIFFSCVMNGSNHLEESDSRPLHLCPVDLQKLHSSVRFDVGDRYGNLAAVLRELKLEKESMWYEREWHRLRD